MTEMINIGMLWESFVGRFMLYWCVPFKLGSQNFKQNPRRHIKMNENYNNTLFVSTSVFCVYTVLSNV